MLKQANLIDKGEKVLIRHHSSGLELQTQGIALEAAIARQRLQVRNASSGKVVEAIAVAPGQVEVVR
jgi:flagella basal body P-ring formation protein FlgA